MWRDFPLARARMHRGLISLRCGFGGVSYLLAKQLRSVEWMVVGLEARDDFGRMFHGGQGRFGNFVDGSGGGECRAPKGLLWDRAH